LFVIAPSKFGQQACKHEFKILYPYGSDRPVQYCIKCKTKKEIEIKKPIPEILPAFEQTGIDPDDRYRFLTDWKEVHYDGWEIHGTREKHDSCGIWQTKGCLDTENHVRVAGKNQIYVKQFQRSCFRPACEKCYPKWSVRQAGRSEKRIAKYVKKSHRSPKHFVLSIPQHDWNLSYETMRKKAFLLLKETGCRGGLIIFHPYRVRQRYLVFMPHFHVIGFGQINYRIGYAKYNWVVLDKGFRASIFGSVYYLLNHCGIKSGFRAISWFGELSYSKLKSDPEPKTGVCPICDCKLVQIYYDGPEPGEPPPEKKFEGFVSAENWYLVETGEYSDDYDYSPIKSINEIIKGITIT